MCVVSPRFTPLTDTALWLSLWSLTRAELCCLALYYIRILQHLLLFILLLYTFTTTTSAVTATVNSLLLSFQRFQRRRITQQPLVSSFAKCLTVVNKRERYRRMKTQKAFLTLCYAYTTRGKASRMITKAGLEGEQNSPSPPRPPIRHCLERF